MEITDITGYTCYTKDRQQRIYGCVACYVRIGINSERYNPSPGDDHSKDLWIILKLSNTYLFLLAIYHPPPPQAHLSYFQFASSH